MQTQKWFEDEFQKFGSWLTNNIFQKKYTSKESCIGEIIHFFNQIDLSFCFTMNLLMLNFIRAISQEVINIQIRV
jgi:hypothetical protein